MCSLLFLIYRILYYPHGLLPQTDTSPFGGTTIILD